MSKKPKVKKKKIAVTILRQKPVLDGDDQLDLAGQKKALERYCKNNSIDIQDYHYADETYVHWADFKTFLACIKDKSFEPDLMLFTSWEIIAPLLDRFPQTLKILAEYGVTLKSIKKDILKHALNKS